MTDEPKTSPADPYGNMAAVNERIATFKAALKDADLHPGAQAEPETPAWVEYLKDPHAVHLAMLRGTIAKLTPGQIGHLYRGKEAMEVIAEVRRQNPDLMAEPDPSENPFGVRRMVEP